MFVLELGAEARTGSATGSSKMSPTSHEVTDLHKEPVSTCSVFYQWQFAIGGMPDHCKEKRQHTLADKQFQGSSNYATRIQL